MPVARAPASFRHALVRSPSPRLADGLVTHIDRVAVDVELAAQQWRQYVAALAGRGLADGGGGAGRRLPGRRVRGGLGGDDRRDGGDHQSRGRRTET